jgi:glycerophosphoryl diester phosphodiesterase
MATVSSAGLLCGCGSVSGPGVMAHRGASHDAPENTLPAFSLAWQQGADGIEGDYHLTRDGHVVCIHDATTKRTAGKALKIADSSLAELRELDVGSWKGPQWAGTRIPALADVLATVPQGKRVFLEVKCGREILPAMAASLAHFQWVPGQVVVISFDAGVLSEAKRQLPQVTTLWLTDFKSDKATGAVTPSADDILATLKAINADGVDCRAHPTVGPSFVQTLRAAHKQIHVWTVDDRPTAKRLRALGVDSLTSNRAGWLKAQLRNHAETHETPGKASGAMGAEAAPRPPR